jgi:hypothetical protein
MVQQEILFQTFMVYLLMHLKLLWKLMHSEHFILVKLFMRNVLENNKKELL